MPSTLTPDELAAGLKQAAEQLAAPRVLMERVVDVLHKSIYDATPSRSGALRASLRGTVPSATRGVIVATAPYAVFVHEGTKAHEIRPRLKKVLRFQAGGTTVFTMRVRHPGTKANPFMVRGLQAAMPDLNRELEQYGLKIWTEVARA